MVRTSPFALAVGLGALAALAPAACSSSSSQPKQDAGTKDAAAGETGAKDSGARDTGAPRDTGTRPGEAGADAGRSTSGDAGTDAYAVPPSWDQTYTRPTDTAAASSRASCTFARGAMPAQTLGPSTPLDTQIPIEHIVVLMQENRSFDSYLGHLAKYEAAHGITNTIESAPDTATNPSYPAGQLPDGGAPPVDAGPDALAPAHPYQHAPQLCFFDTAHSWGGAHLEYDRGRNDGFFFANNDVGDVGESTAGIAAGQLSGDRALWWYDERDIPFHYSLYSTFAMGDQYYSALLGPTWPNRMYLYSGTSFGVTSNTFPDISAYPTVETPAILFDELTVRGVSWAWYAEGTPAPDMVVGVTAVSRYGRNPTMGFAQFLADAKAGTLPAVSFVDGDNLNETASGDDEHPPSELEIGQHFVWEMVNAVTTGPSWKTTALFITYDENGGIYDHVAPPPACKPDGLSPVLAGALDQSQPGAFDRYGFRVPLVVVSPYAKKSYVSHTVYSHTSITRFIEAKFKIPALTSRDANSDPFTDLFDWQSPPFLTPPAFPEPTIDQAAVTQCASELTATGH